MSKWFYAKILSLVISFSAVVYTGYYLRSMERKVEEAPKFEFAQTKKPLQWCPKGAFKVELHNEAGFTGKILNTGRWISDLCTFQIESFDSSGLEKVSFRTVLKAIGAYESSVSIEVDPSGQVFRVQGLPFKSRELQQLLRALPKAGS
jgi:Zn-dependent metalloprotease